MGRKDGRLIVHVTGEGALPKSARLPRLYQRAVRLAFNETAWGRKASGEINVVFLKRDEMLRMNRHYLGHDYDTDVITFEHDIHPGMKRQTDVPLADIFISAWMANKQAKEMKHDVVKETATLVIHGALHILGHDDHARAHKTRMFKAQDRLVAELGV